MADAIAAGKTAGTFKTKSRGKAIVGGGVMTAARVVELLGVFGHGPKSEVLSPDQIRCEGLRNIAATRKSAFYPPRNWQDLGPCCGGVKLTGQWLATRFA
jgi:hypothetical protein